jgi:predicted amidohydrolase
MKVTVCELSNEPAGLARDWEGLVSHVRAEASEFVLLPEMPFYPWLAWKREAEPALWQKAVTAHDQWMLRLTELAPAVVVSSRPVIRRGRRLNEGFIWAQTDGYRAAHAKYYLPNEEGFWEATWYERGPADFTLMPVGSARIGFLICSELWFNAHARDYAGGGIHLLVCPRATPKATVDKWIAGGRTAAVVSGAYCLSANFAASANSPVEWGGSSWIIEPQEGEVLGLTTPQQPFVTVEIDLATADRAKHTYPRYIPD